METESKDCSAGMNIDEIKQLRSNLRAQLRVLEQKIKACDILLDEKLSYNYQQRRYREGVHTKIVKLLKKHGKPMRLSYLTEELGIKKGTVSGSLSRRKDLFKRNSYGEWSLHGGDI